MLTENQREMLKKKFDKGYTLIEFCDDLDLKACHIGEWEEGNFTELIEDGEYLEYLGNIDDIYVYQPSCEYIEDFLQKVDYKADPVEDINWRSRKVIRNVLEYLRDNGLMFRMIEEMRFLGIKESDYE